MPSTLSKIVNLIFIWERGIKNHMVCGKKIDAQANHINFDAIDPLIMIQSTRRMLIVILSNFKLLWLIDFIKDLVSFLLLILRAYKNLFWKHIYMITCESRG